MSDRLLKEEEISKALDSRLGTEHERFIYVAEAQLAKDLKWEAKTASMARQEMVEWLRQNGQKILEGHRLIDYLPQDKLKEWGAKPFSIGSGGDS